MTDKAKLLALAESCGAVVTGKPDGSEPLGVSFSLTAWQAFVNNQERAAGTVGDEFLCCAWGETDLPCVAIVRGMPAVRQFFIDQWLNDELATDLPEIMADVASGLEDDKQWSTEFEIGGISVEKVWEVAATSTTPVDEGCCPFCRSKAVSKIENHRYRRWLECDDCGAQSPKCENPTWGRL